MKQYAKQNDENLNAYAWKTGAELVALVDEIASSNPAQTYIVIGHSTIIVRQLRQDERHGANSRMIFDTRFDTWMSSASG